MSKQQQQRELTFEVGGDRRETPKPDVASFKISGGIGARRELYVDDDVQVLVMDADGEIIVAAYGKVTDVGFKKHCPRNAVPFLERRHTIRLGEQ